MRVEVYWNLHKNCFSVRDCATGRIILHCRSLDILDPQFVVQEGGRQRVLREKRKNVHAFVRGTLNFHDLDPDGYNLKGSARIGYNPYRGSTFVRQASGTPVRRAASAVLLTNGKGRPEVRAWGSK